jgi:predicted acyl esterase
MDALFDGAEISRREYEIKAEHNIAVKMSDGVNISVDVFRPDARASFPRSSAFQYLIKTSSPTISGQPQRAAAAYAVSRTLAWKLPAPISLCGAAT